MVAKEPLVVTATLAGPLAGEPPMLCGLALGMWLLLRRADSGRPRLTRNCDVPDILPQFAADRFPLGHTVLGRWVVPHCSSPIIPAARSDRHEHYHKRFPVADAVRLCPPDAHGVVPTTMTVTKSYRLPNRVRWFDSVSWICEGNARELRKLLGSAVALGKDRGAGYGVVARVRGDSAGADDRRVLSWDVRAAPELAGAWWFAPHPAGPVLMRPLPVGPWLPPDIQGAARDYAACSPPYWHPRRNAEIMTPC